MRSKRKFIRLVIGLLAVAFILGGGLSAQAATSDLFFSEYIEGSSFNKAVEIYNGTGVAVDLSTYTIELYSNGAASPSQSVALSGTLADGDVFVIAHASADPAILAVADATSSTVINFNGDDAIVLRNNSVVVDSFGQVGFDPGSQWTGGGQDDTLRRAETVCAGDTNPDNAFDASVEWITFAQNTFDGLGSHTANCGATTVNISINDVSANEGNSGTTSFEFTVSLSAPAEAGGVTFDIATQDNSATTANNDYVENSLTGQTIPAGSSDYAFSVLVNGDTTNEPNETFFVNVTNVTGATVVDAQGQGTIENDDVITTLIHNIQGNGSASPLAGQTVIIEGIVVGDFQDGVSGTNGDLNGFHVQEEDADADGDPATSEGIFVFDGSSPAVDVAIGDLVRVEGAVSEFNGLTEITSFTGVSVVSSGNALPMASVLSLPVSSVDDFEAYEGMYVTFPQALVISEYFNFDRFGEIVLTSERHLQPTAEFEPGPAAILAAQDFLLNKITLDDGRTNQNPDPAIHPNGGVFDLNNLFRGGDTVQNVTGVMYYAFGLYRIQPTEGASYSNANPRTASPDPVGSSLKVASFNVLNYFTTLDDGVNDICGPAQNQECRGADNANEFIRQRDKIIAALTVTDADVVGLIEIENHPGDVPTADLVSGLNDAVGTGTYNYLATGAIGTDAIRVALIYKPATVTPVGAYAVLDSSVDTLYKNDKNRPVQAQTFMDNSKGGEFNVAVNHLKSKGSACDDVGDPDTGDGSGNCNLTRKAAAEALVDWLATDPTGSGNEDFLIIGDLNSYDKEDPIDVILQGSDDSSNTGDDYTDLLYYFLGEDAYSYVFDGQLGYLDHALANADLLDEITGVTVWHINADEPDLIDYDTSFKLPAQDAIYAPDPYRSSDHDPVVIGLYLDTAMDLKDMARDELAAALPTGDSKDDKRIEKAIKRIDQSLNPDWWIDDNTLDPKDGNHVFDRDHQAIKELQKVEVPVAQTAIDALVDADRQLALKQLTAAILGGGDPDDIAQAQDKMADAAANVAAGDFAKAVLDYKKAWRNAVKAL